jgi:hypothetical protein
LSTPSTLTQSLFERHPKKTLAALWLLVLLAFAVVAEIALRQFTGMGRPQLFYKHPAYGYRLQPNQETRRFGGAHFKVNNLGLRAMQDWDSRIEDKILFIGDSVTYGGNRVANQDLFSEVAVAPLPGLKSGNAGIPNWGVENVYGLVVQARFLPARIYVTTLIEHDFYRGLATSENRPWIKFQRPAFAWQELAEFVWHKYFKNTAQRNRGALEREPSSLRAERAARKLEAMDEFLKTKGYRHLIFISPTRAQVLNQKPKDQTVQVLLDRHGIEVVYLLDRLGSFAVSEQDRKSWYHDDVHLTVKGHRVWGEVIRQELLHNVPGLLNAEQAG